MASLFTHPAPYHVLVYGLLLGSQVFNSFVGGIVAFRVLPRPQFAQLQSALFPVYFTMQTVLPVALAFTYPGSGSGLRNATGPSALLAPSARSDLLVTATMALMGLLNWIVLGPWTTQVMRQRKHQETRDGRKSYDPPPHSEAMQRLNRSFGMLHGASSLANLVAVIATVVYGFGLGSRLV